MSDSRASAADLAADTRQPRARARATAARPAARCLQCGEPLPPRAERDGRPDGAADDDLEITVAGVRRRVCSNACRRVAVQIVEAGLSDFYRLRDAPGHGAPLGPAADAAVWAHPKLASGFVRTLADGAREASLLVEGITCAACAWLIERRLGALPGVRSAELNYASHRARVVWEPARVGLPAILDAVASIGYRAHPYDPESQESLLERERHERLRRIGIAGVLGMQVMMVAVALYAGDWYGMEAAHRKLFHWVSLVLTVPVVVFSAQPFFAGALRDLRARRVGMDVPVALGISIAFLGSAWATVSGAGTVYYDSVVMFVFFLLVARHFEFQARRRAAAVSESLVPPAPALATRRTARDGGWLDEAVPAAELVPGDLVLVRPGESVPADGRVAEGCSSLDESLLTGESAPLPRRAGDEVVGGAINVESPLVVTVTRTGPDTVLAQILRLVERARSEKPRLARLADRVAGVFVACVLVLAALVAAWWWHEDPARWLPVTVAVLVATCPCALSLATPAAITAATGALTGSGVLVTRGHALETLARATHVVLDKTGTLTRGQPELVAVEPEPGLTGEQALAMAAALEASSEHPLARCLVAAAPAERPAAQGVRSVPGGGVRGTVAGREHFVGAPGWVAAAAGITLGHRRRAALARTPGTVVVLADSAKVRCTFRLDDALRPGARATVAALAAEGLRPSLLSGDREPAVRRVAEALGIDEPGFALAPAEKLARIERLRAGGAVVAAVGDGVNDAPVLAGAQVSVAMGSGADVARASADLILLKADLPALVTAVRTARRTRAVIRQNVRWALAYNALALPAAAVGWVAPWMAAIGMSASSLVVVANALRLARVDARAASAAPSPLTGAASDAASGGAAGA